MINAYRDEIDLSVTKYSGDWKSAQFADEPEYTEEMQIFDRWCRRVYELYRNIELNNVIRKANEGERRQREEYNEFFERRLPEVLGDGYNGEKVFGSGKVHFTNEGFNPNWMDEDLEAHALPVIDVFKEWLCLCAAVDARNEKEALEERIGAENYLDKIKHYDSEREKVLLELTDEDIEEAERLDREPGMEE